MTDPFHAQAGDPATPPDILARIAFERPDLAALVARHPAAYPELLHWIAENGDAAARAAVAERRGGTAAEPRAPRVWPWAVGIGAGVVAIAAVAAVVVVVALPGEAPVEEPEPAALEQPTPAPTPTPEPPPLVADLPRLPIAPVAVQVDVGGDLTAVQRFADDVAAGATDSLVSKCWTFAPATIRDRYASEAGRGAVLDALATVGVMGQTGAAWQGQLVTVVFPLPELRSTYACPTVTIDGVAEPYSPVDAAYLVHRLAGRLSGAPVARLDTEENYPLACDDGPEGWHLAADGRTPPNLVDPAPVNAAVLALDGHPISVTALDTPGAFGDYYEITAPDVPGTALVVRVLPSWVCVGEAR